MQKTESFRSRRPTIGKNIGLARLRNWSGFLNLARSRVARAHQTLAGKAPEGTPTREAIPKIGRIYFGLARNAPERAPTRGAIAGLGRSRFRLVRKAPEGTPTREAVTGLIRDFRLNTLTTF